MKWTNLSVEISETIRFSLDFVSTLDNYERKIEQIVPHGKSFYILERQRKGTRIGRKPPLRCHNEGTERVEVAEHLRPLDAEWARLLSLHTEKQPALKQP